MPSEFPDDRDCYNRVLARKKKLKMVVVWRLKYIYDFCTFFRLRQRGFALERGVVHRSVTLWLHLCRIILKFMRFAIVSPMCHTIQSVLCFCDRVWRGYSLV